MKNIFEAIAAQFYLLKFYLFKKFYIFRTQVLDLWKFQVRCTFCGRFLNVFFLYLQDGELHYFIKTTDYPYDKYEVKHLVSSACEKMGVTMKPYAFQALEEWIMRHEEVGKTTVIRIANDFLE